MKSGSIYQSDILHLSRIESLEREITTKMLDVNFMQ